MVLRRVVETVDSMLGDCDCLRYKNLVTIKMQGMVQEHVRGMIPRSR